MPRGKTYWMVADSVENFRVSPGLDCQGFGAFTATVTSKLLHKRL